MSGHFDVIVLFFNKIGEIISKPSPASVTHTTGSMQSLPDRIPRCQTLGLTPAGSDDEEGGWWWCRILVTEPAEGQAA
jgi:hypothetical protein